ncbi:MAG: hypothetical protein Kow002_15050 [Anaerolineales bacterium]
MKNKKPSLLRSLGIGLGVLLILVTYAYGFQVTKVNLEETKSEHRQQQLFRILRALAKPELIEFEKEEFKVDVPFMMPCPEGGFEPEPPDTSGPYMIVTPSCADPRAVVTIEGYNFEPFIEGPLNFIPADSDVNLKVGTIETDGDGYFIVTGRVPNRPSEGVNTIQAITRRNVGTPKWTRTAKDTWDKIVETVFLALLATTIGTALAIPLSFFAARNLMQDVTSSLQAMALSIILIPVGFYLGLQVASWSSQISAVLTGNMLLTIASLIIAPVLVRYGLRWALPQQEIRRPSTGMRIARMGVLLVTAFVAIIGLYLLSFLMLTWGSNLGEELGNFGFLGYFVRDLGDILNMVVKVIIGLAGAGIFSSLAGRWGEALSRQRNTLSYITHFVLAIIAGAMLVAMLAAVIHWFYQFRNATAYFTNAGIIGAILGLLAAIRFKPSDPVPTGIVIYYVSRTVWNALRSIEALVMAIVFVVWVGIGPFAGSLALALHTIAALTKLYSEQVESIMAGPIEAVQATGATRLQTIVYAVLPQIVPPYISFTMYRWDINVRMSTIIGFAGGGGIGFLLQQNINLLNYRAASAQMLAIAIVVSLMDFISSKLREKVV